MTKKKQVEIMERYVIQGVPYSSLPRMCREAKISYPKLMKYLRVQTMAIVGGEGVVYSWDIERFINGLPCID